MADTPITKAMKFLNTYRTERSKALNNEQVMGWSTSPLASVKELVDVFDSTAANDAWTTEFDKIKKGDNPPGANKVAGLRVAVNFLAGCRRDVRIQYAAGDESRVRVGHDYNRFEYSRLAYNNYVMDLVDKTMDGRLAT